MHNDVKNRHRQQRSLITLALTALIIFCSPTTVPAQALVVLDAGHGGRDPGAVGCNREEATHVLDVAQRTKAFLETAGLRVELTRADDTFVELISRAAFANERQASAFVSIHANSNAGTAASGTETWIANEASAGAQRLAQGLQSELVAAWGLRDRGVKRSNFTVLTATNMPAALTEIGFINRCDQDSALIGDPTEREEIARAHAVAISAYLDAGDIGDPGGAEMPSGLSGTLIGVTFEDTGAGLEDPSMRLSGVEVSVAALNLSARSAVSTGAWSFEVPPGTYTVRATLDGFTPAQRVCVVESGQDAWCSLGLSPQNPTDPGGAEAGETPPLLPDMGPDQGGAEQPLGGDTPQGGERPPAPVGGDPALAGDEPPLAGEDVTPELPIDGGLEAGAEAKAASKAKRKDSGCQATPSHGAPPPLFFFSLLLLTLRLRCRPSLSLFLFALGLTSASPAVVSAHVPDLPLGGGVAVLGGAHEEGGLHIKSLKQLTAAGYAKAFLSPDGQRVLLIHRDQSTVSVLELNQAEPHRLTSARGAGRNPTWHLDSQGVALRSPDQSADAVPLLHLNLQGELIPPPLMDHLSQRALREEAIERIKTHLPPEGDELFHLRLNGHEHVVAWGLRTGLWLYRESDMSVLHLGPGGHPNFSGGGRYLTFERTTDDGVSLRGGDLFYVDLALMSPRPVALTQSAARVELAPHMVGERLVFVDLQGRVWLAYLEYVLSFDKKTTD